MRQLPIRLRLTLVFSVAIAVVLSVVGMLAYHRLAAGFADDLDRQLRQRAQDLIHPVSKPDSSLAALTGSGFIERGESFAELLTPRGGVMQATSTLAGKPLLSPAEAAEALKGTILLNRAAVPGLNEAARLLATPVTRAEHSVILVVGGTRENGLEALRRVRTELLLGLPLLLLVTTAGAYLLAGAAFRPVEQMRRRAAVMSGAASGQRLPLPPGNDEVARLGVTLNELLTRVDAALEQERLFVANASHELRTPLALLKTELELARRRPRPVEALTAAIDSAADEVERLIRLAENLLLLAGADDTDLRIAPEQVEITALLATISTRFQPAASELGRDFTMQPGDCSTSKQILNDCNRCCSISWATRSSMAPARSPSSLAKRRARSSSM